MPPICQEMVQRNLAHVPIQEKALSNNTVIQVADLADREVGEWHPFLSDQHEHLATRSKY